MPASTPKPAIHPADRRRRRHARFRGDFRVTVSILQGHEYHKLEGHCRDLSEAGMGILLAAELNVGEVVGLSFALPGVSPWELRAVLRFRRGYQYGFEFLSLPAKQREVLRNHLKGLTPID
jgi:PilZ domain